MIHNENPNSPMGDVPVSIFNVPNTTCLTIMAASNVNITSDNPSYTTFIRNPIKTPPRNPNLSSLVPSSHFYEYQLHKNVYVTHRSCSSSGVCKPSRLYTAEPYTIQGTLPHRRNLHPPNRTLYFQGKNSKDCSTEPT